MKCEKVRQLLSPYQDNECDKKTTEKITSHLKKCHNCRQELTLIDGVIENMKGLKEVNKSKVREIESRSRRGR